MERSPDADPTFAAVAHLPTSTVEARGTLDRNTVELLSDTIDVLTTTGHLQLTLDLIGLTAIDDAGVALIAELQHDLFAKGGQLQVIASEKSVRAALTVGKVR